MIKIEPISSEERAGFAVHAELEHPTVMILKVMEHPSSWPEYEILELPIGKSKTVIEHPKAKNESGPTAGSYKWFTFPYNPDAFGKGK